MEYETIIGLETHAELLTESKLWCSCPTRFGAAANSQTCPICTGMPGVLPVLNQKAFELSVKAALALGCQINRTTYFDRKGYYYPDLPKNYQISQNYCNLGVNGSVEIPLDGDTKEVGIWNVHLEEDAGKNLHVDYPGADYSLVDLNRAGTPLLEIVSAPDMRSVEEAEIFMQTLRQVLTYTEVSDCKMQEGSLRFEASISMRPAGSEEPAPRVEIKNLNSIRAVTGALKYEVRRQRAALEEGKTVARETRLWDEQRERTARMRSKEEAQDYRYFPEPDLVPYEVTDEWLVKLKEELPELPLARRRRFRSEFGLSNYDAEVLTNQRAVADRFEEIVDAHPSGKQAAKSIANWVINYELRKLNELSCPMDEYAQYVPATHAALVIYMKDGGGPIKGPTREVTKEKEAPPVTGPGAEEIADSFVTLEGSVKEESSAKGKLTVTKNPVEIAQEKGLEKVSDSSELDPVIEQVIDENPQPVEDYLNGKKQAVGALVGQVMRITQGKADPKLANKMLREKLDGMED